MFKQPTQFGGDVVAPTRGTPLFDPSRNPVHHTGRCFRAKYFSLKNQRQLKCESYLEMRVMRLLEFANGIVSYSEQPPALRIRFNGRWRQYTPDIAVRWMDGSTWLVEVKPVELARTAEMRLRFQAADIAARLRGSIFRVLTDKHVSRASAKDIGELLALRLAKRVQTLGDFDDTGSAPRGINAHGASLLLNALANGDRMRVAQALLLMGGGSAAEEHLKAMLAARQLAWNVDRALTATTQIHLHTEADDEALFA